ncbi:LAMI_0D03312g1_1 [Lachancea mirantina]|uniref:LAMI_0D03312g1_1 n=1 Tax=Lachancea mirantina TaxID=1230905 RepID=A0A1G4JAA8_9SACH|nr:LAMI_0D03312g1_1 [Lachancea mirantina]
MEDGYQELDEPNRKKRGSLEAWIKLGVILVLLVWGSALLISSLPLEHHSDHKNGLRHIPKRTKNGQLKVSFANLRNDTFSPVTRSLRWLYSDDATEDDQGFFLTEVNGTYVVRSVFDKDYSRVLLEKSDFVYAGQNLTAESIIASPDQEHILLKTDTVKNWRHSTFGSYYVFDTKDHSINFVGNNISLALWSPNSNDVAYVFENNVYVYSSKAGKTIAQVTHDGSSQVFNGIPDWVYEEEVFEGNQALWWSTSGEYLSFLKINETEVHEFPIAYYVQHDDDIYPEIRKIKYPKSGTPNPSAEIQLFHLETQHLSSVFAGNSSTLVTEMTWLGGEQLLVKVTDRTSDTLSILLVDAGKGGVVTTPRVCPSGEGWWEITHRTTYLPKDIKKGRKDEGYIDLMPVDGFNHLAYFSPPETDEPVILTRGEWEVVDGPTAVDLETNNVYFIATKKSSTERHLYRVNILKPEKIEAITDTSKPGTFSVSFSSGSGLALLNYLGPDIPYQKIVTLRTHKKDSTIHGNIVGKTLYYLEDNAALHRVLNLYDVPKKTFGTLELGHDQNGKSVTANYYEILPNDFDPSRRDHYPVFFFAYGGPNSQQVLQIFSVGFNEVVSSQLDAIVVVVDGRGTGFRGKDFRSYVRDNLGDLEAQDQIEAAKIYGNKPYVNQDKISLFGWSYGGYLTLKTLEKDAGKHFKYGMSVAPVTDWRFYDSVYTERYMHTPQENPEGYRKAKVSNATALGQAQRFLLMHGTGDDNVHFQNSLKFLDLLDLAGVENYDFHVFPDSDHSIRYHNANIIVFDKLLNWIGQAYDGQFVKIG